MEKIILRLFVIIALLASGCAKSYKSSHVRSKAALNEISCIVVLPFDSQTTVDGEKPGRIVATILSSELFSTGKFKVLEWEEIDTVLKGQNVTLPANVDEAFATKIGEILSVEGVIFGSVTEYGYKKGGNSFQAVPVVGLIAKLLSVRTKGVVWSATYSGSSSDFLDTERDPLSGVALGAVKELVSSFASKVKSRKIDYSSPCWNPFLTSDLDNDGILNFADACPVLAEDLNGIMDTDGCPEPEMAAGDYRALVDLEDDRIVYKGNIEYVPREATLLPTSAPILKGIASLINEHPEIKRVMIEGFSEDMGSQKYREEFSFNRAMAVKNFLMNEGIPSYKLSAVGYEKIENWRRSFVKEIEFSISR
jgi:hypothetical protein